MSFVYTGARRRGGLATIAVLTAVLSTSACQCGSKPIPDVASSSFRMDRDALAFPNFVTGYDSSALDTAAMQRMFGDKVCTPGSTPCELTSAARTFMEQANTSMSGGRCEGFAVLSDLMAAKKVDPKTFGADTARELTLDDNTPLQKEIAYWFATQLVPGAVGSKTKQYTAKDVLGVLADSLEDTATEHYRIGIVRKNGASISGGHSLTPIGFYRDPKATGVYWLRVYDNNHPEVERLMKLDTVKNRWEFESNTNPNAPSCLYFGDSSNNNPIYLAPVFARQGVLPCPFCEGGGAQVVTTGGAQPSITTPTGTVGLDDGEISTAAGTSITPSFSDPADAEGTSFVIGLGADAMSQMGSQVVVNVTMPPDPLNPDAFQGVAALQSGAFTTATGLRVTARDTFTATPQGGTYTNNSHSPMQLTTRIPTGMGELTVTAFVSGGSDSVSAQVDAATGRVTLELSGAMGTPVAVQVQGRTTSGDTRSAQFFLTGAGSGAVSLQAETTSWMQGGLLTASLNNGGATSMLSNACTDGVKSGQESDVDCGAVCNAGCAVGLACGADADCASGFCHPTQKVCLADSCTDTRKNADETDVDCGGHCEACAAGRACRTSGDCADLATHDCVAQTCQRVFSLGAVVDLPSDISGAGAELELSNGADRLTISSSGTYRFPTRTTGAYAVTISRQPSQASCTVGSPSGTATANVLLTVTCVRRYLIGGLLTGLPAGETVTLQNNGASPLVLSQNTIFSFPLQPAGAYNVTVSTQPASATCLVTNGSGPAPTADVTSISVECTSAPTFTIGGSISGLGTGKSVTLDNNGERLTRMANGAFTFATPVTGAYAVTVVTQPMGQACVVTNDTGTATMAVTNVTVTCADTFTLGGTLSGLGMAKTVVLDNGSEQLTLSSNGSWQFLTPVSGMYSVTVATQPQGQTCTIQNATGTATMNVGNVTVTCAGAGPAGRDTTFGTNGYLTVAQTANGDGWQAMVINPDGTMVLAGFAEPVMGSTQWLVSKVTASGAIDTTFGASGHRLITKATGPEQAYAIARDSMGRYLVAGALRGTTDLDLGVARLTAAGVLDTTFGTNGVATFDFGGDEVGSGLALDSMGRIVVVGRQGQFGGEMLVARLTTAGVLDSTFATGGRYLPTTTPMEALNAVVLDTSNDIFAVGFRDQDSLVIKLTAAGVPDSTFGTSGVTTVDLTTGLYADQLNAVALDGTRLVAAGSGLDSSASNFYLAAFTSAGVLDTTFGAAGVTGVGAATPDERFTALAARPGGGWYAVGSSDTSVAVLRFSASGAHDMTFGTSGQFLDTYSGQAVGLAAAVDSLGRIVIAGVFSTGAASPSDPGVARINP